MTDPQGREARQLVNRGPGAPCGLDRLSRLRREGAVKDFFALTESMGRSKSEALIEGFGRPRTADARHIHLLVPQGLHFAEGEAQRRSSEREGGASPDLNFRGGLHRRSDTARPNSGPTCAGNGRAGGRWVRWHRVRRAFRLRCRSPPRPAPEVPFRRSDRTTGPHEPHRGRSMVHR